VTHVLGVGENVSGMAAVATAGGGEFVSLTPSSNSSAFVSAVNGLLQ
jgi:hypothetical protein